MPNEKIITRSACSLFAALALSALCGCSRSAADSKSNEFFTKWLQGHGESNIVVDAAGVGLAGNPTRLRTSLYDSKKNDNSFTAELEFQTRIPDGREIIDFVAGSGDTLKKAEDDAKLNFLISTFHVLYRSFLNSNDTHQAEEKITINGQPRLLVLGDTIASGQSTNTHLDLMPLRKNFRELLSSFPLSPQTHWIKLIYAQNKSEVMLCEATLDSEPSPKLNKLFQALPWPKQEGFYMVKQFIVVK